MIKKILAYIDITSELESTENIHEEIKRSIVFKGTNFWILVFAIVIASVGLNINSTAVVIGAMLISPLMGPINGLGYSVATYDFLLFRQSLKNLGFAVAAGLFASTMYFSLTPVTTAASEILARTTPTIYDVIIAMFGGVAGIMAISSKRKGNVIPGVAIATALMPPLCTAGYGLGTGQMSYFFGAIYLFTINTVFIALSAMAVSRFFKFPISSLVGEVRKKKIARLISVIIFITVAPSIYFGYQLVLNEKFNENATRYVENITIFEGSYLLKSDIEPGERRIDLVYAGKALTKDVEEKIRSKVRGFKIEDVEINIQQGFSLDEKDHSENEMLNSNLQSTLFQLEQSNRQIDSLKSKPMLGKQILAEAKQLYPGITTSTYSETILFTDSMKKHVPYKIVTFTVSEKAHAEIDQEKLLKWLKARLLENHVKVYFDVIMETKSITK